MAKKFLVLLLVIGMVGVLLTGCGGGEADTETIKIIVSHNNPQDSPEDRGMQAFKELVEEKTGGRVQVEIYPALQLGSMREQVEATQGGAIHITQQPTAVLSTFVPMYELVDFPYLWPDFDTVFTVLDGEIGKRISAEAEKEGLVGLGWMASGFKQFTARVPITSPDDMKGLQMRVMPAPLLSAQMEAWGARPVPIEFGELYNALQQGVVDGQENPIKTIFLNRLFEVQDYLILSDHGFLAYGIVANKAWFENLPEDIQTAIREAMAEACQIQREILKEEEDSMLKEIEAFGGTEIIKLSDEAKAQFRELALPVHQQFADRVGKDLLEATYTEIERVSGQ